MTGASPDESGPDEFGPDESGPGDNLPAKQAGKKARPQALADQLHGPSPNIATNLAIADIALRGGSILARHAVERAFLGRTYAPNKARKILKGRTWSETLVHGALARMALRSVPGAILVGGALVAKTLYDRAKARDAKREGEARLDEMARTGEAD